MKKFLLIVFILFDVLVIVASGLFLYSRIKAKQMFPVMTANPIPSAPTPAAALPQASSGTVSTSTAAVTPSAPAASVSTSPSGSRKMLFSYRNAKARKVMIRADFTGWRAEPMQKDTATSKWSYTASLEPGEYAYCFFVDDKSIRDPANKRTKLVGKTRVSSIVVQPAAPPH